MNLRPWMSGSLGWGGSMGGGAGGRALLWGSCWRRAMSALALLRCAWAASSLHHPATRRPPFPCCRFSRLSVANSVGGAAVPRVCEGGSAGLRRQAGTLPGYGDEGTCCPTLEAPNSLLPPPTGARGPRAMEQTCLARGFPQGSRNCVNYNREVSITSNCCMARMAIRASINYKQLCQLQP